ncbi:MAG: hypothetical protein AAGE94_07915 [Acidobacteriota bacterium]
MVIPLVIHWRRKGRHAAVRGLLIIAGIACLLTAPCTGFSMFSFQLH